MNRRTPLGEDPFLRLNIVAPSAIPHSQKEPPRSSEGKRDREEARGEKEEKGKKAKPSTQPPLSHPIPAKDLSTLSVKKSPSPPPLPPQFVQKVEGELKELLHKVETLVPESDRTLLEEGLEILTEFFAYLTPIPYYRIYQEFILSTRSLEVDPFGLDPAFEARLDRWLSFLYEKWWRVQTTGVENIPPQGRAMIVANRGGIFPLDGAMLKLSLRILHPSRRTVRFLVENYFYHAPFLGVILTRYGAIRASYDNARRLLKDHQLVAVFPEGILGLGKLYRDRYQLQRFARSGFIRLAMEERAPIIPAAIVGSEEIYPLIARLPSLPGPFSLPFFPITPLFPWLGPLGLIPLPIRWRIILGEPFLDHLQYNRSAMNDELLLNQLNLKIRRIIHEFLYEELARRKSLFFG
jgi:1-acyl-sn-glycerol-3-phosphate acyltransferase